MRSYSYHDGAWQSISDPLATVLIEPSPMTGGLKIYEFSQALKPYGFSEYGGDVTIACRLGDISIYVRDHQRLTATRQTKEFPYDFVCLLSVSRSYIRVWLADLPSLFLFLSEIEAHPELDDNSLEGLINDKDFQSLLVTLPSVLSELWEGNLEITVKPPKLKRG